MAEPHFVADIGGTNARFAVSHAEASGVVLSHVEYYQAVDFPTIYDAASAYMASLNMPIRKACFAVAGPIRSNEVTFSNSHWELKGDSMKSALKLDQFLLINDFYALAAGVTSLPKDAFVSIKAGLSQKQFPQIVIGPGTGFGQALIVPTKNGQNIIATEGGHVSFAALNDEEFALRNYIATRYGRLSVERVLSGLGLVNIYEALHAIHDKDCNTLSAAQITMAAQDSSDSFAVKTLNMFCAILGSVAGDAVLACGARGGVVLGGGILPKILPAFEQSTFVERFCEKGRMTQYVKDAPVRLIVDPGTALYGASKTLSAHTN